MSRTHQIRRASKANETIATAEGLNSFGVVTKDDQPNGFEGGPLVEPYLGLTVFDTIPELSLVGQIVAYRSIANSSIVTAIYLAHEMNMLDRAEEEKFEDLRSKLAQRCELYNYAAKLCLGLTSNQYDAPMTVETAYEFARDSAVAQKNPDLPDEVLEMIGISRTQLRVIDAEEERKQAKLAAELRTSIRDNEQGILAEIASFIPAPGGEETGDFETLMQYLPVQAHANLFEKVAAKLGAQMQRLLAIRSRYSGALADVMLISGDVKTLDKERASFLRQNAGALRDAG